MCLTMTGTCPSTLPHGGGMRGRLSCCWSVGPLWVSERSLCAAQRAGRELRCTRAGCVVCRALTVARKPRVRTPLPTDAQTWDGDSALHLAVDAGDKGVVELLLR